MSEEPAVYKMPQDNVWKRLTVDNKWHKRFMRVAEEVATWSKDPSTKVGAVITKENRIISTGYNGLLQGIDDSLAVGNRGFKIKNTIHAEHNAIKYATNDTVGATLYVTHYPCEVCTSKIIEAGISVVYVLSGASTDRFKSVWGCDKNVDILKANHIPVIEISTTEAMDIDSEAFEALHNITNAEKPKHIMKANITTDPANWTEISQNYTDFTNRLIIITSGAVGKVNTEETRAEVLDSINKLLSNSSYTKPHVVDVKVMAGETEPRELNVNLKLI